MSEVWVYAEAEGDKPATSTLELLTKAREIGDTVEAVYVGTNADALAGALGEYGATTVHAVDAGDTLPGVIGAAALGRARRGEPARPDPVRADLRRSRRAGAAVGQARPAGAHERARAHRRGRQGPRRVRDLRRQHADRDRVRGREAVPRRHPAEVVRGRAGRRRRRRRSRRSAHVDAGRAARGQGQRAPRRGAGGPEARGGDDRRLRRARASAAPRTTSRWSTQLAKLLGGASGASRAIVDAGLGAVLEAGRPDRQDREAEALHRARHLRCDAAPRRHEGLRQHHRHQQGRRGADLRRSPTSASSATCTRSCPSSSRRSKRAS